MLFDDLDMMNANPREDYRATLSAFGLPDLLHLEQNLPNLISGTYTDGQGRGCVMYFLSGGRIASKRELLLYGFPDRATQLAARRMVRHFDGGALPVSVIRKMLAEEVAERKRVNALERRAIRRVRAALSLLTHAAGGSVRSAGCRERAPGRSVGRAERHGGRYP
jgi:hypothetical protein